jgi:small subunit ribosomal protein S15
MARMHARRKGRSGSHRPLITENPEWVPLSSEEIEEKVVKMAKDGYTSARIGLVLRDQHAVPNVKLATGKTVTQIMADNEVGPALPEDIANLMRKAINLNSHLSENRGDISNKRGLQLIESKIRRLERYYKGNGVLPMDWKYSIKNAELMLK